MRSRIMDSRIVGWSVQYQKFDMPSYASTIEYKSLLCATLCNTRAMCPVCFTMLCTRAIYIRFLSMWLLYQTFASNMPSKSMRLFLSWVARTHVFTKCFIKRSVCPQYWKNTLCLPYHLTQIMRKWVTMMIFTVFETWHKWKLNLKSSPRVQYKTFCPQYWKKIHCVFLIICHICWDDDWAW